MRKYLVIFAGLLLFLVSAIANGEESSANGPNPADDVKKDIVATTMPTIEVKKDIVTTTASNAVTAEPAAEVKKNMVAITSSGAVTAQSVPVAAEKPADKASDKGGKEAERIIKKFEFEPGLTDFDDMDTYKVQPGDMLQIRAFGITFWHHPGLFIRVSEDGQIQMPLIGEVKLAGLDATDAAKKLDNMLLEYVTDPQLALVIHERIGWEDYRTFSISGAVKRPGVYRSEGTLKLIDAVNWGGGLADSADPTRVKVTRIVEGYAQKEYILNLFEEGMDFNVKSRDRVFVEAFGTYVICGEVMNQGRYSVGEKTRVADAVLMAGGFTEVALRNSVTVIRKQGNGRLSLRTSGTDKARWTSGNRMMTNGKWHYVIVTMARNEEKSKKKKRDVFETIFYVDGKKSAAKECRPITSSGDQNLYIGKQSDGAKPFKGGIADVRIYKRALSEKEVKKRFKEREEITDGLISIWKRSGDSGLEIFDDCGGNKGINKGADIVTGVGKKEPPVYFWFEEKDDYIDCGSTAELDLTTELTVEAWVMTDSWASQTIVSRYDVRDPSKGYIVNIGDGDHDARTQRINVPVGHIFETGNEDDNIKVEEEDMIIVDESFF